ncbi:ATPase subunit of ABC transporter with duplicated ATPase domains [Sedimentibacter acidaminivorans]|uniref:ATPase subunit of ABC transporter with duplicated ATPase domains n=1 Tax=Sedimentibacter acidaminivorans TaxID=913099 RepID=A0ABS4GDN5_9FIRM|nr:ABC-F type ribosomal protection protein [Sedimentibacter acidaminivorans]MBP1925789.1 ATPase subunit of ABC transporter with duplicated ATPase domains [Sedimentibacter acidaminivorans]
MIEIGISNLTKLYGVDKIFENVTFDVKTKDKIGLVGRNGTGKTTLMKILAGYENFQGGQINKRKGLVIGYLEQIPNYEDVNTVADVLNKAFQTLYDIKKEMENLEMTFDCLARDELESAVKKYSFLHDSYEIAGGYDTKEKLNKILSGLDINEEMQKREFNTLSGGEKTRVILGKILLENPDLLLLDEPSNHLDIKSVEWLEEYLSSYEGTIVIVSHDRYFLDRVANKIIELESDGVQIYNGGYSKYVAEKELRFLQAMKEYESQQKKIKKMEEQIQRYRIWGEMRDSDKMYKRAKELEKRLEKIDKINKPIVDKKKANFEISGVERTGKEVIKLSNISKSYGRKKLFSDVNFNLFYSDSMCILGENGTGKSTILKIIIDEIKSDGGEVKIGSNVKIGYLPQEVSFDREDISIVDYFSYYYSISLGEARKELASILFTGDDVYKHISTLSGGEKSRLKLGMLIYEKVNTLILDEPTNHLDIDSREILEENLINYDGTILFVSHDRYFVDKISTCIGEIENRCFKTYNFNYEGYKQEKQRVAQMKSDSILIEEKKEKSITQSKEDYLRKKEEIKKEEKQKRDLQKLESNIFESENKLIELEKILNTNSTQWDLDEYNNKYNEYNKLKEKIELMYMDLDKYE